MEPQTPHAIVEDYQIQMSDFIMDDPKSIVAQSFKPDTRTFRYLTVEDINKNDYKQTSVTINHSEHFPQYHQAPLTHDGRIFLVGGFNTQSRYLNTCYQLDLKDLRMIQKQSMITERCMFSGVIVGDLIQALGGNNGKSYLKSFEGYQMSCKSYLKSCERYDIKKNAWQAISDHPYAVARNACCSFNDKQIYSISGSDGSSWVKDVCMQDVRANKWEKLTVDMAAGREVNTDICSSAIQINQKQIYVFGGNYSPKSTCLLEVDQDDTCKLQVKEINRIQLSEDQSYWNNQNHVISKNKLYSSFAPGSWIYKTSCFDSKKWQTLL